MEFIAITVVIFFFLLFFLSLSFVLVISDYIDYATFMAARTYKSSFGSPETQLEMAQRVFDTYTEKINTIARNFRLEVVNNEADRRQSAGLKASYDIDIFYLPPLFITEADGGPPVSVITLSSETHLGRDPAISEVQQYFNEFSQRTGLGIEGSPFVDNMDDNGF